MRKNRALGIAAIWLALIALVCIYTDRDAYTWRYAQEELPLIMQSQEQAAAAQQASDAAYAKEAEQAAQRQALGQWGGHTQYADAMETLPARDDVPGLNLMWGTYEVNIAYTAAEPLEVGVVSAGRQAFIEDGGATLAAAPDGEEASFAFTLTDSTERVMLACDLMEGAAVKSVTVRKCGTGVFSRDLAAYAALVGGVLTWLYLISGDLSDEGKKRRRDALVLVLAAAFASLPALMEHIVDGHDLFFHINRIEGIAAALRSGQFPVRIHASTLLGYGYAASEFYPELFLYIPAVLRNLGVSLMASVQVMMMLINLATALVCYKSAYMIAKDRDVSLLSSVLYTLSIYRLVSLYATATLGEALAMIFFPMVIASVHEVLVGDASRWPLLALAMFGVFMSHLLSTLLAAGFCALAALCCAKRLLREPKRILACVKAALLMALCSMWFVLPFIQYSAAGISTNVALDASRYRLTPGELMMGFSRAYGDQHSVGNALGGTIGAHPGLAILLGCALFAVARYAQGGKPDKRDRLPAALLSLGVLALLATTAFFPWARLCRMSRPFGTIFQQIQYPRRMLSVATPLLCIPAAWGYLRDKRHQAAGAALAIGLCVVFAGYFMGDFVMQQPILDREGYADTRIRQYEYTYLGTEKGLLRPGAVVFGESEENILAVKKNGTGMTIALAEGAEGPYLEAPLLDYPGYRATINGEACRIVRGNNNVIRLYGPFTGTGDVVQIGFKAPLVWRMAEAASLAGLALLAALLLRRREAA